MNENERAMAVEAGFVIGAVIALKEWIFPFFIWRFFPTGDLAALMLEWMMIMVSVITCVIYLGLGSSARHLHGLSLNRSVFLFLSSHLPLILLCSPISRQIPFLSPVHEAAKDWGGLIGDGLQLFHPLLEWDLPLLPGGMALVLFLTGRFVQVVDESQRTVSSRQQPGTRRGKG
ncbi:hypothetical protein [Salinithrix halophila]|uniref:Uncharacterized protein n=1 Tax=Salinithrix halophila TaxID=1485204 RepID=A0ABV8JIB4_9BACL